MALFDRRKRGEADRPRALVAAASRIDLTKKQPKPKRQDWQEDALVYYDEVPEVKQLVLWRGNQLSKLRMFVATRPLDDPEGEPIPVDDERGGIDPALAQAAVEEMDRLASRVGGKGEILRRLELNTEVVGEAYVVGFGARTGDPQNNIPAEMEDWTVASIKEVEYKSSGGANQAGTWVVKRQFPNGKTERTLDPVLDTIFRAWQPHAAMWDLADSSMRALLGECEALMLLSNQLKAESKSRASAGILTVPNELSFGLPDQPDTDDGGEDAAQQDPFMAALVQALAGVVDDPLSIMSVVPLLLRGPGEFMKPDYLRKIDLSRQSDQALDQRINVRIQRVARGLNAPPEVVMGHQQTTFSNARQVDADTWEDYLEPKCTWYADLFTVGYLHDRLLLRGFDPVAVGRVFVWYDPSDMVQQPDQAEGADGAFDRLAISLAAYRRAKGYAEDDAPDEVEMLLRLAFSRGPIAPNVTNALLEAIDSGDVAFPLPDPQGGGGAGGAAAAQMRALATVLMAVRAQEGRNGTGGSNTPARPRQALTSARRGRSGAQVGRQLVGIDRDMRIRLLVAANDSMNRALEKAGARARTKVSGQVRSELRQLGNPLVVAHLGRGRITAAGLDDADLLADAWDALEEQFMAWGASAQRAAIEAVNKLVGGFSQSRRDQLGLRLADSLGEAWGWMKDALTTLAEARLYDPHPAAPPLGEFDPSMRVPPGLVRQAISRAGGTAGLQTREGDAWVALTDAGRAPAGGIATGEVIREVLRDEGVQTDGFVWDYGDALRTRPFEPHMELDGVTFSNFDDPVLANEEGWPEFGFYMPGDHDGCMCDAVPILLAPGEEA